MKTLQRLFLCALFALCSLYANAYDFSAENEDGKKIYYNILSSSEKTVEVTYGTTDKTLSYSGDVVVPSSVTYNGSTYTITAIGDNAFNTCTSLNSASLPNTITTIGDYAFYLCAITSMITLPSNVESIGMCAFWECQFMYGDYVIPKTVTYIGSSAFYHCAGFKSVVIEDAKIDIGNSVFNACNNMKSISLGSNITSISDFAFSDCNALTKINIPDDVQSIGIYAFENCTSLTEVQIGKGVTSLGKNAFYNCSKLEEIYSYNTTPPACADDVFSKVPTSTCYLYVPKESINSYSIAYGWKDFENIFGGLEDGLLPDYDIKIYDTGLGCDVEQITKNEIFWVSWKILNTSTTETHYGTYQIGLCDKDGCLKEFITDSFTDQIQPNWWKSSSFHCGVQENIEEGDRIRMYYKEDDYAFWKYLTPYNYDVTWEIVLNADGTINGIEIVSSDDIEVVGYYTIDGKAVNAPQRGVNIVKFSDGTTKKVMMK